MKGHQRAASILVLSAATQREGTAWARRAFLIAGWLREQAAGHRVTVEVACDEATAGWVEHREPQARRLASSLDRPFPPEPRHDLGILVLHTPAPSVRRSLAERCRDTLVFDERGSECAGADIVVRPQAHETLQTPTADPRSTLLTGLEYATLDPRLRWARSQRTPPAFPVRRLAVVLGSGDHDALNTVAIEALALLGGRFSTIDFVLGPLAAASTEARLAEAVPSARVHRDSTAVPEILASADLALTSGGQSRLDAAVVGTPCLMLPGGAHQLLAARESARSGVAFLAGPEALRQSGALAEAITTLAADASALAAMSARGRELSDGLGLERVFGFAWQRETPPSPRGPRLQVSDSLTRSSEG